MFRPVGPAVEQLRTETSAAPLGEVIPFCAGWKQVTPERKKKTKTIQAIDVTEEKKEKRNQKSRSPRGVAARRAALGGEIENEGVRGGR